MKSAWAYLQEITRHPHRGTATSGEAAAAADLQTWLDELGYGVDVQEFQTPVDTLYLGPAVVMLGFTAAALLGRVWPWPALLLCALLLIPMVGEMLGSPRIDFDLLLPTYRSRNVIARKPARSRARRTLVISAHYDTQRASLLFHPAVAPHLQTYFTIVYILLAAVPAVLLLRWAAPGPAWVTGALTGLAAVLSINICFLLACRLTGRHINGANDNGTGSALVMALADRFATDPLPDTELIFLLTGAEEVGTRGMKAFMKQAGHLDPATTCFINLDNLGGGSLHYLLGEGMLAFRPYDPELVGLAGRMAAEWDGNVRSKRNLLLPTDGSVPAQAGFPAISFLAFRDDGSLPDYHWYSDTLAKIDRELLAFAESFLVAYVRNVAQVPELSRK